VHKWRSETDAILVGKNTAFIDNPQLTNRLYFGKKANVRILLDKNLSIKESNKIYDSSAPTWVLTQREAKDHDNVRYFRTDFEGDYLHRFLKILYENKIGTLMIEGGAKVLQSFIEAGFWDEARVFKTKKFIGEGGILAPVLPPNLLKEEYRIMDDFLQIYQKEA
jgi:diaminohydroxyphosphoribosylaminopyrimidine deaminase/5-amino-6-(5-phosphoribosylamino)uracil reductase